MKDKVEAIYDLREAAEYHALAEAAAETDASALARDALLGARERLEAATVDAIESCHHCGEPHASDTHVETKMTADVIPIGGHAPAAD